jgi:valyl-tRNA synthetase
MEWVLAELRAKSKSGRYNWCVDKAYDHKKFEAEIYKMWEESGDFKPKGNGKPYTILMPPPNANASLHAGHAMYTIDDIMIRFKRMQGFAADWIPGADHAGFETQFVYEKQLAKEGKSRMDFDRQTLYDNVYKFVKDNSGLIHEQFKRLGLSADWERNIFTLDRAVIDRVMATFTKMESEGKIYRDEYMVNYCTHCGTSLAELEVDHEERTDPLYYMKYGPFVLATVRPETKFGDTAVAVHPDDKRYKEWVGKEIEVEGLIGKFKVRVIADELVDPKFGTGAVKVTPAHDPNDFDMGRRHGLEIKQVIGLDGRLNEKCGKYAGLKVAEARKIVVEDMQKSGMMEKIDENYKHVVSVCYKCHRILEPMVVLNWFIKVGDLKKPVVEAVNKNKVRFFPRRFKKQMIDWLTIMHDWPISRQIAWGIRIPAWYNLEENPNMELAVLVGEKKIRGRAKELLASGITFEEMEKGLQSTVAPAGATYVVSPTKPNGNYLQETDTFDTWFSSGQWPLVTLKEDEFESKLPTDFMGTLSDILKLWVSRMIMFSLYVKNEVPFKDVYLWSKVVDSKGQKMSKSKGNVVNPIEFVDKYGADAVRMSLVYGVAPGSEIPFSEDKIRGMRNLANKIWNSGRFVQNNFPENRKASFESAEISKRVSKLGVEISKSLEKFHYGLATEKLYDEFWHWFCDECIEKCKSGEISKSDLFLLLEYFLKLFHPFMPFVTEAVWQELKIGSRLINEEWPACAKAAAGKPSN